jgi:hypothetical protein
VSFVGRPPTVVVQGYRQMARHSAPHRKTVSRRGLASGNQEHCMELLPRSEPKRSKPIAASSGPVAVPADTADNGSMRGIEAPILPVMGGGSGAFSASRGLASAAGSYDEVYVEHGSVGEVFVVECVVDGLGGKLSGPLDWCGDGGEFGVDDGR